jgi:sugar lactone lactonase YvrE
MKTSINQKNYPIMKTKLILIIAVYFAVLGSAKGQAIGTVAGNGINGFSGDGGPVSSAEFNHPLGIAFDKQGNAYVADANNNRIRKINSQGIITTFAGTSVSGYSGDGGAATDAKLNYPSGVACDDKGNVYVADMENSVIRKINKDGIITTVAGNGIAGYGGDRSFAIDAQLNDPSSVTVDASGNLYIADYGNDRIRKVNSRGVITTIAGTGVEGRGGDNGPAVVAELNNPASVVCDASGNLYIADENNNCIRKISRGIITTIAGNGEQEYSGDGQLATKAGLFWPTSLAFDAEGNLYIADNGNLQIRKIDQSGIITTVSDNKIAKTEEPGAIAFDATGNMYISYDTHSMICRNTNH